MSNIRPYQKWPDSKDERRNLARRIFGLDLVTLHQETLEIVEEWFETKRLAKRPNAKEKLVQDWLAKLPKEAHEPLLTLVRLAQEQLLFSLLVRFDGASGESPINPATIAYRLHLEIYPDEEADRKGKPKEDIILNPRAVDHSGSDEDLHDDFFKWMSEDLK